MSESSKSPEHVVRISDVILPGNASGDPVDISIEGGIISSIEPSGSNASESAGSGVSIDGTGKMAIPGLIDLHFHGAVGFDFCDGTQEAISSIAAYEARSGITTICPATMTYPEDKLSEIMKAASEYRSKGFTGIANASALVGINMEGPYISPNKVGAQNPDYVRCPSVEEFDRLQELCHGMIKIVDIAPESETSIEFTRSVTREGTIVSMAHTAANYDQAMAMFDAGATHVTHLFNAMPGINHREPGPIIAAAESKQVSCELICDGIHLHPAIARFAFDLFGPERIVLISDSMRATGMEDGTYDLGGQDVSKVGNKATLADGTIAGSVSNLYDCLRWSVGVAGIPLEDAVRCATINPARTLRIDDEVGSLEVGKKADILIVDQDLCLEAVVLGGNRIA